MKDEQQFLMNLLDFSNLPSKRTEYESNNVRASISQVKKMKESKGDNQHGFNINLNHNNLAKSQNNIIGNYNRQSVCLNNIVQSDAILNQPSQKLLQSFNNLRQKLQSVNRENLTLRQQIEEKNKQINEYQQRQNYFRTQINEKNKKTSLIEQQLQEYKRRLQTLKQSTQRIQVEANQLESLKIKISTIFEENQRLKEQLNKNMEISLREKITLEEQLEYLKLKEIQSDKVLEETENKFYEKNMEFIKLENQFKKLKIGYEEQIFKKKFTTQKDILLKENQELKLKLDQTEAKYRKEKNKKYQLEKKLLELEEKVRLYGTKTDIYEGELDTICKKMKKVQKNQSQTKRVADAALQEKLSWQQKFYNSLIIGEQLISRVKRQLLGDVVELAKVAEFKLNKLKNDEKVDLFKKDEKKRNKSSSTKKLRSQSALKKMENIQIMNEQNKNDVKNIIIESKQNFDDKQCTRTVLKQTNTNIVSQYNNLTEVKKNLFNAMNTPSKSTNNVNQKASSSIKQTYTTDYMDNFNLEAKIRKERQLMERKLREKILYNKIEDSTNETTKNRLRDQFLNIASQNI